MFIRNSGDRHAAIFRSSLISGAVASVTALIFCFLCGVPSSLAQSTGTISTIAGTGGAGFSGDGGTAANATLNQPVFVAVGPDGSLYIVDSHNSRIRRVAPTGIVSTVAGNGSSGFSGDGGPATAAALNGPLAVAADALGNLFIADTGNSRVRLVNSAGIISTVAGNGSAAFSGDGAVAISASLNMPAGIALDSAGNLYIADENNQRIRQVAPTGVITTIAGSGATGRGAGGYSGDGGQATAATLNSPAAVIVDAVGNIYISDQANQRIRKVATNGVISTVAGSGFPGSSGDGGPATSASLNSPAGLAVDAEGTLYFADSLNARIRHINSTGFISTVAGSGTAGFSGDGGAATSASINNPLGVALDSSNDLYIADAANNRIRQIPLGALAFQVLPPGLSITPAAGATQVTQQVTLSSAQSGTSWTAQASTQSGGPWLAVSPASGPTPSITSITVLPGGLAPGTYRGSVVFQSPAGNQTLSVLLTVPGASSPGMVIDNTSLLFEAQTGSSPPLQAIHVLDNGGGLVGWTASVSGVIGGNWLSVSPSSGTATATSPSALLVTANTGQLAVGVYTGSIQIQNSAGGAPTSVGVTLLVAPAGPRLTLSQTGFTVNGSAGSSQTLTQTLLIQNTGSGSMPFTVQGNTFSGAGWLQASPASGTSVAGADPVPVQISVNTAGLAGGQYAGTVNVDAAGAPLDPNVPVSFYQNLVKSHIQSGVQPQNLFFTAPPGETPPPQGVVVFTLATSNVNFVVGTFGNVPWLSVTVPTTTTLVGGNPSTVIVQVHPAGLAPGTYTGTFTVGFGDGSPTQTVTVTLVVPAVEDQGGGSDYSFPGSGHYSQSGMGSVPSSAPPPVQGCTPTKLAPGITSLGANFSSPVGWASPMIVQLVDDCTNPLPNAAVLATFSNGDRPLALKSLGNGTYTGTWLPSNAASGITVTVRADMPGLAEGVYQVQGAVAPSPGTPVLFSGGLVNAASSAPGAPLAPSGIISIYGRGLASAGAAASVPLPTTLGGATLSIGGIDTALFYSSDGQINAQIPAEIPPNTLQQAYIKLASGTVTMPQTIVVGTAAPGIFSVNQQGNGQGAILSGSGALVDGSSPAGPGDVVEIFATGLGPTQPSVPSGQGAPGAEPLARVSSTVTATIGGQTVSPGFAGLAPGFVGLYQVNVTIPSAVQAGPAVPVVINVNGVPSNTVTIAVHN